MELKATSCMLDKKKYSWSYSCQWKFGVQHNQLLTYNVVVKRLIYPKNWIDSLQRFIKRNEQLSIILYIYFKWKRLGFDFFLECVRFII